MVLAGLNYLHMFIDTQYKVIHRDVKSSKSQFQVRDRLQPTLAECETHEENTNWM
uniref:Protein kinase domain-containing protein n=1 Tax=Helianthus annuus TaxID=4232 RepID=A0A251TSS9_HELAN